MNVAPTTRRSRRPIQTERLRSIIWLSPAKLPNRLRGQKRFLNLPLRAAVVLLHDLRHKSACCNRRSAFDPASTRLILAEANYPTVPHLIILRPECDRQQILPLVGHRSTSRPRSDSAPAKL